MFSYPVVKHKKFPFSNIIEIYQNYGRKTVTDFEDIVSMDLDYIDNWSLMLDIKIILRLLSLPNHDNQKISCSEYNYTPSHD